VRHATGDDLDQIEDLLAALRAISDLREQKRGYFSRRSRAFVHFHADDDDDYFADVKLGDRFVRLKVTSSAERNEFLARVRRELQPRGPKR
jgi:hypothetical protein